MVSSPTDIVSHIMPNTNCDFKAHIPFSYSRNLRTCQVSRDVCHRLSFVALCVHALFSRSHYKGASEPSAQPLAFVGKGITFDSGGISLKPGSVSSFTSCCLSGVFIRVV